MPAYRSDAEGEVRTAVVERLRQIRPTARIMHEVNACAFGNRIDVLAVDRAEIIAVEIKSAKDKLDRLPDQLKAMKGCAHHVIAALHEKFLVPREVGAHAAHYERDGKFYVGEAPRELGWGYDPWIYPLRRRCIDPSWRHDGISAWGDPGPTIQVPLPSSALDMLWRDELLEMCGRFGVCVPKRPTMSHMLPALRWQLSGRDLTLGICAALRARKCIEADAPVEWRDAA
jgi:hypothetical protein